MNLACSATQASFSCVHTAVAKLFESVVGVEHRSPAGLLVRDSICQTESLVPESSHLKSNGNVHYHGNSSEPCTLEGCPEGLEVADVLEKGRFPRKGLIGKLSRGPVKSRPSAAFGNGEADGGDGDEGSGDEEYGEETFRSRVRRPFSL